MWFFNTQKLTEIEDKIRAVHQVSVTDSESIGNSANVRKGMRASQIESLEAERSSFLIGEMVGSQDYLGTSLFQSLLRPLCHLFQASILGKTKKRGFRLALAALLSRILFRFCPPEVVTESRP